MLVWLSPLSKIIYSQFPVTILQPMSISAQLLPHAWQRQTVQTGVVSAKNHSMFMCITLLVSTAR